MLSSASPSSRSPATGRGLSRRNFVKLAALAAVPLPRVLVAAAESLSKAGGEHDRILVVVQLSGGNDGLNTVIPAADPHYREARPSLAIQESQALALGDGGPLYFHPQMTAMQELYKEGRLAVVQGVGYPNPDRSHFRSMEIWHTARPDAQNVQEGWLGRTVARGKVEALDIGDSTLPLALAASGVPVPALQNLNWLDALFTSRGAELRGVLGTLLERRRSGDLEFLRGASSSTFTQLDRIEEIRKKPLPVSYPRSDLGQRLEWTGQMIAGGLSSRIYYVSMDGFDTHAQQEGLHGQLLKQFSDASAAFYRHMEKIGRAERVVLMAFSEFGRRVKENGSRGTDHGYAGPVFVVSGAVRGGIIGGAPDLEKLESGDVPHTIDFRRLYATVLDQVLGVPSREILGQDFEHVSVLGRRRSAAF
jgi:uncharacterized protein (DUF1501 family)